MMTLLAIIFATVAPIAEGEKAATNLFIISDEVVELGLSRQALLDGGNGKVIDRSGTVVSHADAAAQMALATNLQQIATATANGVTNALQSLWDVTNQIPSHAEHIALYLPRQALPLNLTGEVISEGTDGVTDWQIVEYSQLLTIPPNRHVEYTYLNVTATVECVWDKWDKDAYTHRCTFTRPTALRGKLINSRWHETIGGAKGFDFGSALVTVDGKPTFTGAWTNSITGEIHNFRNGIILKQTKETSEDE
jgi:hypothetical protein